MKARRERRKVLTLGHLVEKVAALRKAGKVVVQSHGVFDLIHPGIIQHLRSARSQGDVLVVTVIRDRDVRRGPGRPIFPEALRAENVAALQEVDLVAVVEDSPPYRCVGAVKPDVFAKGRSSMTRDREAHNRIFLEARERYLGRARIFETHGVTSSASSIINNFLDIYPEETKAYLRKLKGRHGFDDIKQQIDGLRDMKVLLIGDGIVDEYHYVTALGKSAKAHLVVSKYLDHEVFAGGVFAIANHISGLCDRVHLVTMLGADDDREAFVRAHLRRNVEPRFFVRPDGPTVIKKRYINRYLGQKLFEVNYLNDVPIAGEQEAEVIAHLRSVIGEYDIVLVSDFGHGFITGGIIKALQRLSNKKMAVNTQTNAANSGFNMITKYHRPFFVCLDETELRWAAQERFADVEAVARKVARQLEAGQVIITLGKQGCLGISGRRAYRTPIFSSKVVDTVGAGDAFFAFTAPCLARGMPMDLVCFVGNAVGAIAVQIMGNKRPVEKDELLEFMDTLMR